MIIIATIVVENIPGVVLEIFMYQSGKKIRTETTDKIIGRPNKSAMGNPRVSLLKKVFSCSLLRSQ